MFKKISAVWSRIWTEPPPPAEIPVLRPEVAVEWDLQSPNPSPLVPRAWLRGHRISLETEPGYRMRVDGSSSFRRPCPITLRNVGSVSAYNLRVKPIRGKGGEVKFEKQIACLAPGESAQVDGVYFRDPPFNQQSITYPEGLENLFQHEVFLGEDREWVRSDSMSKPVEVIYESSSSTHATVAILQYKPTLMTGKVAELLLGDR